MSHYEETEIGKIWVSDVDDWFASLSNLISECRNYTVSEIRFQEILKEHNEKVRAETIEEYKNALLKYRVIDSSVVRRVAEQMKE